MAIIEIGIEIAIEIERINPAIRPRYRYRPRPRFTHTQTITSKIWISTPLRGAECVTSLMKAASRGIPLAARTPKWLAPPPSTIVPAAASRSARGKRYSARRRFFTRYRPRPRFRNPITHIPTYSLWPCLDLSRPCYPKKGYRLKGSKAMRLKMNRLQIYSHAPNGEQIPFA